MNYKDQIIERLKSYQTDDIIITTHAEIQALHRGIDIDEVKANIINPKRLLFAGKQANNKYDCYFVYSKTQCQRYILVLKNKCIVCTVIKINRRWQCMVEKYAKL